jgi:hypothetical protein
MWAIKFALNLVNSYGNANGGVSSPTGFNGNYIIFSFYFVSIQHGAVSSRLKRDETALFETGFAAQ